MYSVWDKFVKKMRFDRQTTLYRNKKKKNVHAVGFAHGSIVIPSSLNQIEVELENEVTTPWTFFFFVLY